MTIIDTMVPARPYAIYYDEQVKEHLAAIGTQAPQLHSADRYATA